MKCTKYSLPCEEAIPLCVKNCTIGKITRNEYKEMTNPKMCAWCSKIDCSIETIIEAGKIREQDRKVMP